MNLRKKAGLTQRAIAVALDVRESTISEWERGLSTPHLRPSQVKKMLEVYQCSLDELIEAFEGQEAEAEAQTNGNE
ncbi:helix-turn-helix domain-containing protein [Microcoleus sp. FACHB-672]|uniref:helix-turn-helix domain-containing protein n=1 Tax=Microcoleus sp. FACHB-672 TaxID=2692825 RepID=UPI0018EFA202|nr:helix-turn-helix transcriptional regulator [Microcoleus sp. FACHB-672]